MRPEVGLHQAVGDRRGQAVDHQRRGVRHGAAEAFYHLELLACIDTKQVCKRQHMTASRLLHLTAIRGLRAESCGGFLQSGSGLAGREGHVAEAESYIGYVKYYALGRDIPFLSNTNNRKYCYVSSCIRTLNANHRSRQQCHSKLRCTRKH